MFPKLAQHKRMKRKAASAPNVAEERHMSRVAAMGCFVCGADAEIHHAKRVADRRCARDHRYIVALCPFHHRDAKLGYHGLGNELLFEDLYGLNISARAVREWQNSCGAEEVF